MSSTNEPIVCFEAFSKSFGSLEAVRPLDLEIANSESFAFLGPNGGGKTTVLRALVGLHSPTSGRVLVRGSDIAKEPDRVRKWLAYVPQRVNMPDVLTAREVLDLFAGLRKVPEERVDEVLDLLALSDDADRRVGEYSGGMLQRLGLAAALLEEVPLLVLDEPTLNLDPQGIDSLHRALAGLKERGSAIVFSSHSIHSAVRLADRIGVLVDGELVTLEPVAEFQAEVTRQTTVRVVLDRVDNTIVQAAEGAGAEVRECNATHVSFRALPEKRLDVIRAIENAGGTIEEFHTEAPGWESLVHNHFNGGGDTR
ncbi:MAG: ABC transporter ATP-binding protein [Acidobacteria bacterium]|nr:ABC transporter ATP-binding protein [Candidatus Sulfomarinibacter sp. MAG AM1]